jgi:nucleoside-diphosphate-sugar epimerase
MIILITGANGFVGRKIVAYLEKKNVTLRLITRKNIERIHDASNDHKVFETKNLFSENKIWWHKVLDGVDIVIHAAWYAEPGKYLNSTINMECLSGTLTLASACRDAGVKKFVGIGTCFEYQNSDQKLSENSILGPVSLYATCKAATFSILLQLFFDHQIAFSWCRLFYLYGDGEDPRRLVPYLHSKMKAGEVAEMTSGTQVRDFLDVEFAAEEIVEIALSKRVGAINIASGVPVTIKEFAEKIADIYGRRDLLKFGVRKDNLVDPKYVVCDKEKK